MEYSSRTVYHVIIRICLVISSITVFFLPMYKDLSGYQITYIEINSILSIYMILFIFSQLISWLRNRHSTEVKKRNTIKLNDMVWLLLMTLGILSTYLLYVTESFYHRFEISYLTHQERFPDVTAIEDYVKMSYQIYAHIAVVIALGIYLLSIYVIPIIIQKKRNKSS